MWHCVALGSSTSMEMTQVRGLAFILVITAILLRLVTIGKVAKKIDALIEEHVEQTSQTRIGKIVIEASKDLMGEYLICNEGDPSNVLSLNELELVFDSCKELNFPSLQNRVYTFEYL